MARCHPKLAEMVVIALCHPRRWRWILMWLLRLLIGNEPGSQYHWWWQCDRRGWSNRTGHSWSDVVYVANFASLVVRFIVVAIGLCIAQDLQQLCRWNYESCESVYNSILLHTSIPPYVGSDRFSTLLYISTFRNIFVINMFYFTLPVDQCFEKCRGCFTRSLRGLHSGNICLGNRKVSLKRVK